MIKVTPFNQLVNTLKHPKITREAQVRHVPARPRLLWRNIKASRLYVTVALMTVVFLVLIYNVVRVHILKKPFVSLQEVQSIQQQILGETLGLQSMKKNATENIDRENAFDHWAILDNKKDGYKFIYPYGFAVSYENITQLEILPPDKQGKIVVNASDKTIRLSIDTGGCSDHQKRILEAAASLVSESFQFIGTPQGELNNLQERFENK